MKRSLPVFVVLLSIAAANLAAFDQPAKCTIEVLFSPHGGCTDRIVQEIDAAKKSIRIQAYSFTSAPIAKALMEAKRRGVDCEAILDKSQESQTYSELDFLYNQQIPAFIDDRHAIAHNKIILIDDGQTLITGSFNFTKAAEESNAENLLVLKGYTDLAAKYRANYAEHRAHARRYEGKAARTDKSSARARMDDPGKAKQAGEAACEVTVYVTDAGKMYHSAGCSFLGKSARPIPLSEAAKRYRPCSRCHPPVP